MSELSKNKVKWLRSLQIKKFRDSENVFVIEGEKMITEAMKEVPHLISSIYCTKAFSFTSGTNIETEVIPDGQLKQISTLHTPNKAIAVLKQPIYAPLLIADKMTLVLDGIQDPGNMGTIIRIADWFGMRHIICSSETVDCYNAKVIQASMGSIFRTEIHYCNLSSWLKNQALPIYKATMEGKNIYQEHELEPGILIMGNEGKGISENVHKIISNNLSIPSSGNAESLNVAVATGILLSEFARRNTTSW